MARPALAAAFAALLAASACSPGAEPPAERNEVRTEPAPKPEATTVAEPAARAPGEVAAESRAAPVAAAAAGGERRCGWLVNPTPGNWWLVDRDGQWVLGTQGNELTPGMEDMPDMSTAGWVETNGHYGHGCACLTISWDSASRRVVRVADATPKPLRQCRADKTLPPP